MTTNETTWTLKQLFDYSLVEAIPTPDRFATPEQYKAAQKAWLEAAKAIEALCVTYGV